MRTALVLGGSLNVMAEADAALDLFDPDVIAGTNDIIARWPGRMEYVFTLHPEKLRSWLRTRHKNGYPKPGTIISSHHVRAEPVFHFDGVDRLLTDLGGSSGLFAVNGLLRDGFDKIVVAGVPLSPDAGHIARGPAMWNGSRHYRKIWEHHFLSIARQVRSMSGWTQELLGAPTAEWLETETKDVAKGSVREPRRLGRRDEGALRRKRRQVRA